jgi:DNA helicase-2/ATP-dependent DNA helicase PcrA
LEKLNPEQRQAVTHGEGPLLIVAGAGTGKTTVITDRIVYLIETGQAKPEEILAVTFTDKAANEMEERADRALPFGYLDLWISTFHAFSERVLKDNGLDIGLPTDFRLLDQTAAWLLMRQNLDQFNLRYYKPRGNPNRFIRALLDHFSRCKDQMIYPDEYLKHADDLKTNLTDLPEESEEERIKEVAGAYHVYQQLLLENNFLDFGDLINYCLQLFQKRPAILEKYRQKFKYILVDEFQDTNKAQYELIKLLAEPRNNLTVCADDDQAIYKWRGASVSNIKQFKNDFSGAAEVCLVKNYRSGQNVLDLAYQFIQANNPNRLEYLSKIDKKLQAQTKEEGNVQYLHFKSLEEEARGVVKKITEILKKDKAASFNDFIILVRANDSATPFARALDRAGLPYQFLASRGLYQKPVVLDAISYLKLLDNYHESLALYRILSLPFLKISNEDVMHITHESHRKAQSVYETLSQLFLIKGIKQETVNKITFLLSLIARHTELAKTYTASQVLVSFLNDSGYLKYLTENDKLMEIDLLTQFYKKIKSFEESALDASLKSFLSQLNWELEGGEQGKLEFDPEQGPEMIKIMTIHAAKGLEFKYVFVVSLVDRRFPSTERKDSIEIPDALAKEEAPEGDVHLQEERRLFYVAMTRAKKGLFLTSADNYGGQRAKKPSLFLVELGLAQKEKPKKEAGDNHGLKEAPQEPTALKMEKWPLPDHFSFTQITVFQKCPYQYKLAHILKVPVKGRASFSFGQSVHHTLNEFLRLYFQKPTGKQESLFGFKTQAESLASQSNFDLSEFLKIYEKNWVDEWYENKRQKQEYWQLGKEILTNFYEQFIKKPPQILKLDEGLGLEKPFHLKIGEYMLKGQIDRLEQAEGGVRIVDYKTGRKKEKLEVEDKTQLLIYQIAAEEFLGLNPVELSYYYLEDGSSVSFLGTEAEKEKIKTHISEVIEKIKASDFKAKPGWQCQFCDFKDICHFAFEEE